MTKANQQGSRPFDPSRVLVHVGVPKSATTTLQFNLFAGLDHVTYLGKMYDRPGVPWESNQAIADLVDAMWTQTEGEFDRERASALLTRGFVDRPLRERVVLSEEGLTWAGAVDRLEIARRIRRAFGRCAILITIREQRSALWSFHRWMHARRLVDEPFDRWIARGLAASREPDSMTRAPEDFVLRQYRFGDLIGMYQNVFGADRVAVIAMEQLRTDPDAVSRTLADLLGTTPEIVRTKLTEKGDQNTSVGRLGSAYQRLARRARAARGRLISRDPDWRDPLALADIRTGMHGPLMRAIARIDRPPPKPSPASADAIAAYYRSDNARAMDLLASGRSPVDLGALGYAL